VSWADGGAPEGNAKDTPAVPHFETGWNIGKPDLVSDIGKDYDVPAQGVVAYQYFTVPTNFTEDKSIEAAEIGPEQRSAIHHVIVFVQDASAQPGQRREVGNLLVGYAPGEQPLLFEPGTAKLVKAGSKLLFQMHYTPRQLSGEVHMDGEAGREPARPDAAHAPPRQGFQVHHGLSRRARRGDPQRAEVRLQLAARIPDEGVARAAEGNAHRLHRPLRQFAQQQVQFRPQQGSEVGRPDMGRNDDRLVHLQRAERTRNGGDTGGRKLDD
jgi:hypothetical protein